MKGAARPDPPEVFLKGCLLRCLFIGQSATTSGFLAKNPGGFEHVFQGLDPVFGGIPATALDFGDQGLDDQVDRDGGIPAGRHFDHRVNNMVGNFGDRRTPLIREKDNHCAAVFRELRKPREVAFVATNVEQDQYCAAVHIQEVLRPDVWGLA